MTIKSTGGIFGRNPTFNNVDVEGALTVDGNVYPSAPDILVSGDIGVTVQGYDVDTAKLDVVQTWSASQTFTADAVLRVFGKSDGIGYELVGRPTDGYSRFQSYDRSGTVTTGSLSFFEDGSIGINRGNTGSTIENAKFTTAGNLAFVSGQGIDFSATAGTGTSELFDDYEEGVHTATIVGSTGGSASLAGSANELAYTKLGNIVHVSGYLYITATTMTGSARISLPFTAADLPDSGASSPASLWATGSVSLNVSDFLGKVGDASDYLEINTGAGTNVGLSAAQFQAGMQVHISLTYKVA